MRDLLEELDQAGLAEQSATGHVLFGDSVSRCYEATIDRDRSGASWT